MAESADARRRAGVEDEEDRETAVKVHVGAPIQQAQAADVDEEPDALNGRGETAAAPEAVDTLRRERDDYYDRLLRKTAEFENYRRRVERERREQAGFAAADLLRALLPVVDNLERALEVETGPEAEPYRKGIEIIHRQMLDLLRKRGVTPIEAIGAPFDPHLHEAVIHEASPGHEDGEVIGELQRGYRLGDRLLRPAMVKVAKA